MACILDAELTKQEKVSSGEIRAALKARRVRILAESVVPEQDNAEVVLRYAQVVGTEDDSARQVIARVAGPLSTAPKPATCSMAAHALAIVSASVDARLDWLRVALTAYEQSVTDEDSWDNWNEFWKDALRDLRATSPDEVAPFEAKLSAAGRRFAR